MRFGSHARCRSIEYFLAYLFVIRPSMSGKSPASQIKVRVSENPSSSHFASESMGTVDVQLVIVDVQLVISDGPSCRSSNSGSDV